MRGESFIMRLPQIVRDTSEMRSLAVQRDRPLACRAVPDSGPPRDQRTTPAKVLSDALDCEAVPPVFLSTETQLPLAFSRARPASHAEAGWRMPVRQAPR